MEQYLVKKSSISPIADEIKIISGTTDKINLSRMATTMQGANAEVDTQADLIAQIKDVLATKESGGIATGYTGDLYSYATATATPGSGATSLTFNNVPKEPEFFVLYLNSADVNQYHRVGTIFYDGNNIYGHEYYSGTTECNFYENTNNASNYRWRYTYSGTTLTISSYNNNQGGYFHNPGTYTLLYAYKDNENGTVVIEKLLTTSAGNATTLNFSNLKGAPVWYSALARGNQDAQVNYSNTIMFANEKGYAHLTNASSPSYEFITAEGHTTYENGELSISQGTEVFSNNDYTLIYAYIPYMSTIVDTAGGTATSDKILSGYTAYSRGKKVEGNIPSRSAQTIEPTTSQQEIPAGVYLSGKQTIKAIQTQTKTATTNGIITADAGKYLTSVTVAVPDSGIDLPTLNNPGQASDLVQSKQLIDASGAVVTGTMVDNGTVNSTLNTNTTSYTIPGGKHSGSGKVSISVEDKNITPTKSTQTITPSNGKVIRNVTVNPIPDDYIVPTGTMPITSNGVHNVANYASVNVNVASAGSSFTYPDGAFIPVTTFTAGKQYALVALIDGNRRYINTTTYNNYTMNATAVNIKEDAGDYVIFSATPVLFTAVASGNGFLLQNGTNYLHGTTSNGTALRVGTTQAVWTIDSSATGGFSEGKYLVKEDANAVWLFSNDGTYNWSIKYETAGSFGYDRSGRDNTYSTGFVSFILYEYVAGESASGPIVDTSDATASKNDIVSGKTAYVNGRKIEGVVREIPSTTNFWVDAENGVTGTVLGSGETQLIWPATEDTLFRQGTNISFRALMGNAGTNNNLQVKTGQTTSRTINTGLSSIDYFVIGKDSVSSTGLINLRYDKSSGTTYIYASAWSTNNYGTKTITTGTTALTVSGGTVTIPSSTATTGGLSSNTTYNWIAVGQ